MAGAGLPPDAHADEIQRLSANRAAEPNGLDTVLGRLISRRATSLSSCLRC